MGSFSERTANALMAKSRSPLIIIFITVFIDLVGFGIVIPVLPLYAQKYGASETVIGLLLAVYSVMQFIFAPILGKLSDRVGRRPVLLVSLIGTAIGFLTMGLANTLWLLFLGRIIDGITGGNISTAQAYIADVTPPDKRSSAMGLIGAAFGLGFIFGPALGGLLSHISLAAPFYFAAGLAAANALALYFLLPESLSEEHRAGAGRASITQIFQESGSWQLGAVFATYFFGTIAFAMLTATYTLFTSRRFDLDATHNGYIFASQGVIGVIIQGVLLGRLIKLVGEKALAVTGTFLLAGSMLALPLVHTIPALLFASAGIAFGNSFVTPVLNGLASKSVNAAWQGRVLGVLQSVASLARIIGPALGGFLLRLDASKDPWQYGKTPFWTGSAIMVIAIVLALSLHSVKKSAAESAAQQNAEA
jgi:DHA1 family tetracycline resistance protein-like MFS transporter